MATKSEGKGSRIWRFIKRLFLALFFLQLFYILLLKWVNPPITLTQLWSWVSGDGLKRDYVNMQEISWYPKLAVIAAEDQLFPDHSGFDWKSIEKAMAHNEKNPQRVKGASTISQQVAKNVFLWQGRSWIRKGLEVYFTFMIELVWGKKRILEMYLNVSGCCTSPPQHGLHHCTFLLLIYEGGVFKSQLQTVRQPGKKFIPCKSPGKISPFFSGITV